MKIVTSDFTQLINLRDAIDAEEKIRIEKVSKSNFTQDFLDNKFSIDLNSDKVISFEELEIIWGWLAQGKPKNVQIFISNASVLPAISEIPDDSPVKINTDSVSSVSSVGSSTFEVSYEGCSYDIYYKYGDINQTGNGVDSDDTNTALDILLGEISHPEQDSLEFALANMNKSSTFTGLSFSELLKIDCVAKKEIDDYEYFVPANTELSSDWNMDGEVDEQDLLILERFVLIQPSTLEEYNKDRGEYPLAKCLPDLNTAKYQCPVIHESCLTPTPTPTPSIINLNSVKIKECCINGNELDISVEYNVENSTNLFIHVKPGEFKIAKTFSNVNSGLHTIKHTFENVDFEVTQVVVFLTDVGWAERIDSDVLNEITTCETPTPTLLDNDSVRILEICMDKDDLNITVEYNTPRKTNLYINVKPSEMDLERRHRRRMYGRRRRRRYVDYDECGECEESRNRYNRESDCGYEMVEEMQYYDCCDEIEEIFNDVTESGIIEYTFSDLCFEPSEVIVFLSRTGWNPCAPQQTISDIPECPILCPTPTPTSTYDCDSPHPDDLQVNYGDYLIFKRWLELDKTHRLDKFNLHRDYAPIACRLPYNKYDTIGTSSSSFQEVYDGLENL